jgi:hypothetical protein
VRRPRSSAESPIGIQVEGGAGAGAADGVEHGGGGDFFAAFQADDDLLACGCTLDGHDFFVEPEGHADAAHVVLEGLDRFLIDKLQQARTAFDEGDVNAHGRQDRGIFRADHPAADDSNRLGECFQGQQAVGVDDAVIVEGNM